MITHEKQTNEGQWQYDKMWFRGDERVNRAAMTPPSCPRNDCCSATPARIIWDEWAHHTTEWPSHTTEWHHTHTNDHHSHEWSSTNDHHSHEWSSHHHTTEWSSHDWMTITLESSEMRLKAHHTIEYKSRRMWRGHLSEKQCHGRRTEWRVICLQRA